MSIEEQILNLERNVEAFVKCINSLAEEALLTKLNGWTPRDIIAHLIGWNRAVIKGSQQIMTGKLPFYDLDPGKNFSKTNAAFVREYSSIDKNELLRQLQLSSTELTDFLRTLKSEEWSQDYGVVHKEQTVTVQNTVDELIEDYPHHQKQIEDRFMR